jgi:hypothetical protein
MEIFFIKNEFNKSWFWNLVVEKADRSGSRHLHAASTRAVEGVLSQIYQRASRRDQNAMG